MIVSEDIILSNEEIAQNIYKMRLQSSNTNIMKVGQFVNVKVDGYSLRRPFGIYNIEDEYFEIIYRVQGDGTKKMATLKSGESISVLEPLGHGFPLHEDEEDILILGGGIGVPPLYELAKQYRKLNKHVVVVLGFNDSNSIICEEEFKQLGCDVYIATMDGSKGAKGTVIDATKEYNITEDFVYACGSKPMLQAISDTYQKGYISAEARMACGMGACMGCVCKNKHDDGYKRVCKEGPVFAIGEVNL